MGEVDGEVHGAISIDNRENETGLGDVVVLHVQGDVGVGFALELCDVLQEAIPEGGSHGNVPGVCCSTGNECGNRGPAEFV